MSLADPRLDAAAPALMTGRMLIDGALVESAAGAWLEVVNPADETLLGRVPLGAAADVDAAVAAGLRAQPGWAALPMAERAAAVHRLADAILERTETFARIEALDTGNLIGPMHGDVVNAVARMRRAAGLAFEVKGDTVPATAAGLHLTVRVPYGVVGRIIPFNHPIGFAASRIAPAILVGNALVLKPSEQSPLSASLLAQLCAEHLPAGVVNIVTGGREAGEALVRHPSVKRIAFIGSVASGLAVQRAAAETSVKQVTLELGGKNPLIAFCDADPARVAAAVVEGMNFGWQGQSCGSTSRVLLQEELYDDVLARVLAAVRRIRVGHPLDPDANMGPLNNAALHARVLDAVESGRREGAVLLHGGGRPAGTTFARGFWMEPTVFGEVRPGMRIAQEEIFGPVVSVMRFRDEAEAVALANGVDLGLTAAVWTQDISRALRVSRSLEAGYIWLNGVGRHYPGLPYGGMKNSGVGREEGIGELLSFTEEKVINFCS